MIAGLEEPTSGKISVGDLDITYIKPYERPVNTVFQNYALFPHLTIFENVAFGLRRRGIKDVDEAVMKVLDLVELSHLKGRKPGQLSGGQQQRIALHALSSIDLLSSFSMNLSARSISNCDVRCRSS